jgi:hypothetical protein
MTPSSISQVMTNQVLAAQNGGGTVAEANFSVNGGDALIGVSASAWATSAPTPISIEVWVDGQPTGQKLGVNAAQADMHLSLGHTWAYCQGLSPGQHTIMLIAGETTVTDANDFACATVWEMGDGCAVRFNYDEPSPVGTGELLIKDAFKTEGGTQVFMSASSSGWTTGAPGQTMGSNIWYGAPTETLAIFMNNSDWDLAAVPADFVTTEAQRGQQLVQLQALASTSTDSADIAHLTVVEFVDPANAPIVRAGFNSQAQSQHGDGGTIASIPFTTGGGTLLFRVSASAWTSSANVPLQIGMQINGNSIGEFLQLFANPATTHVPMVTNDLVVTGVQAGNYQFGLIGEINTITDQNDRVSIVIMEFPS